MNISKENLERFVGDCPGRPDIDGMLLSDGYAYSINGKILVITKLPEPQDRHFCKEYEDLSPVQDEIWLRSWQVRELLFFLKSQKLTHCAIAHVDGFIHAAGNITNAPALTMNCIGSFLPSLKSAAKKVVSEKKRNAIRMHSDAFREVMKSVPRKIEATILFSGANDPVVLAMPDESRIAVMPMRMMDEELNRLTDGAAKDE